MSNSPVNKHNSTVNKHASILASALSGDSVLLLSLTTPWAGRWLPRAALLSLTQVFRASGSEIVLETVDCTAAVRAAASRLKAV